MSFFTSLIGDNKSRVIKDEIFDKNSSSQSLMAQTFKEEHISSSTSGSEMVASDYSHFGDKRGNKVDLLSGVTNEHTFNRKEQKNNDVENSSKAFEAINNEFALQAKPVIEPEHSESIIQNDKSPIKSENEFKDKDDAQLDTNETRQADAVQKTIDTSIASNDNNLTQYSSIESEDLHTEHQNSISETSEAFNERPVLLKEQTTLKKLSRLNKMKTSEKIVKEVSSHKEHNDVNTLANDQGSEKQNTLTQKRVLIDIAHNQTLKHDNSIINDDRTLTSADESNSKNTKPLLEAHNYNQDKNELKSEFKVFVEKLISDNEASRKTKQTQSLFETGASRKKQPQKQHQQQKENQTIIKPEVQKEVPTTQGNLKQKEKNDYMNKPQVTIGKLDIIVTAKPVDARKNNKTSRHDSSTSQALYLRGI